MFILVHIPPSHLIFDITHFCMDQKRLNWFGRDHLKAYLPLQCLQRHVSLVQSSDRSTGLYLDAFLLTRFQRLCTDCCDPRDRISFAAVVFFHTNDICKIIVVTNAIIVLMSDDFIREITFHRLPPHQTTSSPHAVIVALLLSTSNSKSAGPPFTIRNLHLGRNKYSWLVT